MLRLRKYTTFSGIELRYPQRGILEHDARAYGAIALMCIRNAVSPDTVADKILSGNGWGNQAQFYARLAARSGLLALEE